MTTGTKQNTKKINVSIVEIFQRKSMPFQSIKVNTLVGETPPYVNRSTYPSSAAFLVRKATPSGEVPAETATKRVRKTRKDRREIMVGVCLDCNWQWFWLVMQWQREDIIDRDFPVFPHRIDLEKSPRGILCDRDLRLKRLKNPKTKKDF